MDTEEKLNKILREHTVIANVLNRHTVQLMEIIGKVNRLTELLVGSRCPTCGNPSSDGKQFHPFCSYICTIKDPN